MKLWIGFFPQSPTQLFKFTGQSNVIFASFDFLLTYFELLGAKCVTVAVYRFGGIEYGDSLCGTNRNVYDVMAT